ncbi:MAG TPA: hypothetical protein VF502_18185 [Stellaceae bacterium]
MKLIERGIAHELQGHATVDSSGDGLRCSLDIPLAAAQAAPLPPSGTGGASEDVGSVGLAPRPGCHFRSLVPIPGRRAAWRIG